MSDLQWTPVKIKLGQIQPWTNNPRMSTKAQAQRLIRSERRLGQIQTLAVGPMVDGMFPLYDGHQRVSAWLTVKTPDFEVLALQSNRPLTEDERREVAVLLHTATGGWNWDALSGWSAADLREWGMDKDTLSGWKSDTKELTELLNSEQAESADAEPQIDRAAELLEKWQVQTGDLWQIGEHRLLCGDCTKREDIERVMAGERAVMMFTDPPYNFQTEGGGALHQQYAKTAERIADIVDFDPSPFLEILPFFFTERICAYVFCNKDLLPEYLVWAKSRKISFNLLVWKKPVSVPFGDSHRPDIEYLLLFRKGAKWNNGLQGVSYSRLLEYDNQRSDLHPTIKPLELVENQMKITSDKGDIIAEPFAGSGTTIAACQNLGRKCRAIEISPAYVAVALERMSTAFPQLEIKRL